MIRCFGLPRILLKYIRPSKIAELILFRTQFSLNFSEVWQFIYDLLHFLQLTHSTMFIHFGQNAVHNSIHYQSKKFLKCLKICTLVKGSVVQQSLTPLSFLPSCAHWVCSRGHWGSFDGLQRGLAEMPVQPNRPCLFARASLPLHPC